MPLIGNGASIDSPASSPQEAARITTLALLERIESHCTFIAISRKKTVQAIHQLRVDIRKFLAALRVYQDILPNSELTWFRKRLRRLRKLSGSVRDRDVLTKRLPSLIRLQQTNRRSTQCLKKVVRSMRSQRSHLLKSLRQKTEQFLKSPRLQRHKKNLVQGLLQTDSHPSGASASHAESVHCQMNIQLRAIAEEFLKATEFQLGDLESIHSLRIRTKAFRYAVEILAHRLPETCVQDLLLVFSQLQKRLGEINDQRFAWQNLKELSRGFSGLASRLLKNQSQDAKKELMSSLESLRNFWTADYQKQLGKQVELLFQ